MEDRTVIQEHLFEAAPRAPSSPGIYAVFDGHHDHRCAEFAAKRLGQLLQAAAAEIAAVSPADNSAAAMDGVIERVAAVVYSRSAPPTVPAPSAHDWPRILWVALHAADRAFTSSQDAPSQSGATALVVAYDGSGSLHIANLGDCRAVLCRGIRAVDITTDNKATDAAEVARVADAGGFVVSRRVAGELLVSRALGNELRQAQGQCLISKDAHLTQVRLGKDDEFVVLGSDGLFNAMAATDSTTAGSQEVVDEVRRILERQDIISMHHVAEALIGHASQQCKHALRTCCQMPAASDNMPAIVVKISGMECRLGAVAAAAKAAAAPARVMAPVWTRRSDATASSSTLKLELPARIAKKTGHVSAPAPAISTPSPSSTATSPRGERRLAVREGEDDTGAHPAVYDEAGVGDERAPHKHHSRRRKPQQPFAKKRARKRAVAQDAATEVELAAESEAAESDQEMVDLQREDVADSDRGDSSEVGSGVLQVVVPEQPSAESPGATAVEDSAGSAPVATVSRGDGHIAAVQGIGGDNVERLSGRLEQSQGKTEGGGR
ncbi:phosphatase 2C-like domain-containing protein [Tribonema minus]|uniref:Phosphatase 2C-like domain-containing protein n=1 Tax=Tribonema minus TaxID=303371 RepID=A0A836CBE0_9STRA|nr:phosphatase 2C-like domain-containing protein [Tribonema minus]